MPLFAKILAFLNVLVAILLGYLLTLVWAQRTTFSRAAFTHELVLDGMPVDEADYGRRVDRPIAVDLGLEKDEGPVAVLNDLFRTSKPAVKTQDREIERVRELIKKELDGLDENAQRERIKQIMLAQAVTFDELERQLVMFADPKVTTAQLRTLLDDRFEDSLRDASGSDSRDAGAKRRLIAHLLYNLPMPGDPKWHERVMVVVGLKPYVDEAKSQADNIRRMGDRIRDAALDERLGFEAEYVRQRDRILALSQQIDRQKVALQSLKDLHARQDKEIIKPLMERKGELEKDLTKAKDDTAEVLRRQDNYERELFKIHRQIGDLMDENSKLEREARIYELGRVRGGQQ